MTNTLTELKYDVGKEYDVVTISIDPRDTPAQAAEKKEKYVKRYGRFGAATGWHFLTGPESAIRKITNAAGFQYAYDIASNQFAHGTVLLVTTADGRLSRYLFGFEYKPRDLRLALVEASQGKIGGAAEQVLLLCFHYDPATGRYSRSAMNFVRAGGVATVLALASFIVIMIRRERQQLASSSVPLPRSGRETPEGPGEGDPQALIRRFAAPSPASRERDADGGER
jgi:protein SCO1/2